MLNQFSRILLFTMAVSFLQSQRAHSQHSEPRDRPVTTTERVPKSGDNSQQPSANSTVTVVCTEVLVQVEENAPGGEVIDPRSPSYPRYMDPITPSFWYGGIQYNGVYPKGEVKEEYAQGSSVKFLIGALLPSRLGVEMEFQTGSLSGDAKFDYVTTTQYPEGSIGTVNEIPQEIGASLNSLGIRISYQLLERERNTPWIEGWILGLSIKYMWLSEEVELKREEYVNQVLQSSRVHTVSNSFGRTAFGVEVVRTVSLGTSLWFDLIGGYDFFSHDPQRSLPTVLDWNAYLGQFTIGAALRFRISNLVVAQ